MGPSRKNPVKKKKKLGKEKKKQQKQKKKSDGNRRRPKISADAFIVGGIPEIGGSSGTRTQKKRKKKIGKEKQNNESIENGHPSVARPRRHILRDTPDYS